MLLMDIAKYLDGLGYVEYFDTGYNVNNNCFINNLPEKPDNVISIYDSAGEASIVGFTESVRSFQILVRDQSQSQANYISWLIYNALTSVDTQGYIKTDNGRQLLVKAKNPPTFIGKDNNGLFEYSTNFQCWTQGDA